MNARFPRRLRRGADQQLAGQARLGRDLLSRRRRCARGKNLTIVSGATVHRHRVRRPPRHRRQRHRRRRGARRSPAARSSSASAASIRRRMLMRMRHRPGGASARARHRGARRPARRRREPVEPFAPVHRLSLKPEARQSPESAAAFGDGACAFRPACRAAPRTDMYINVQSKTSWSALGTRIANLAPSLWKPMGRGRVALRRADHRPEPLVEINFAGHELDLEAPDGGLPPRGRDAGATRRLRGCTASRSR